MPDICAITACSPPSPHVRTHSHIYGGGCRLAFGLAGVGEAAELCLQVKDFDGRLASASVAGQVGGVAVGSKIGWG